MNLFHSIVSYFVRRRIHQINYFIDNSLEVQEKVFFDLINKAKNTTWGKQYHYQSIDNIATFQQRVPINTYDELKPYIKRIMKGEQNLLWPTDISWFAKSSGTTGDKSKFIPVSKEALEDCHYKAGKDVMSIFCNNHPEVEVFAGKCLILGGSNKVNELNPKSFYGDISGVMLANLPWIAQLINTPSRSISLMEDWEQKLDRLIEVTVNENVTHMAGIPTWTLIFIKRLLDVTGKKSLLDIWPNLRLYMHGGVSFTPYRAQFKALIPSSDMHYMETYNASEGFFGLQLNEGDDDLLLMLDYGIFYEFIPIKEVNTEQPKTLTLGEIELGETYAMVISTNAGLWRYSLGDTVRFTSKSPYKIQIVGRVKHFINAFGEEVMVDNADRALAEACNKTEAKVREYTVAPVYISNSSKGRHQWVIEFEKEPNNLGEFILVLDKALQNENSDYEAKRYKDLVLAHPIITIAPKGTFYQWLKQKGKLGGQNKVPRLFNTRKYMDELLNMFELAE